MIICLRAINVDTTNEWVAYAGSAIYTESNYLSDPKYHRSAPKDYINPLIYQQTYPPIGDDDIFRINECQLALQTTE